MASKRKATEEGPLRRSAGIADHSDGLKELQTQTTLSKARDDDLQRKAAWLAEFLDPVPFLSMPSPSSYTFKDFCSLLQIQYNCFRPFAAACPADGGSQALAGDIAWTLFGFRPIMEEAEQKVLSKFNELKETVEKFVETTVTSSDTWYAGGNLTGKSTRKRRASY